MPQKAADCHRSGEICGLAQAGKYATPADARAEAERLADSVWQLAEGLDDADPAVLRELLGQLVARITCRWDTSPMKGGRTRAVFAEGRLQLRDQLQEMLAANE